MNRPAGIKGSTQLKNIIALSPLKRAVSPIILLSNLLFLNSQCIAESITDTFKENISEFVNAPWKGGVTLSFVSPEVEDLDGSFAWSIAAYRELLHDVGIEVSYFSTGDLDFSEAVSADTSLQTSAFSIGLKGYSEPSIYDIAFYGKFGVSFWNEDVEIGTTGSASDSGTSGWIGFGAERTLENNLSLTIETNFHLDMVRNGWLQTIGVGILYQFN